MKKFVLILIIIFVLVSLIFIMGKRNKNGFKKFATEGTISGISYTIHDDYNHGNYDYSKRGYYVDTLNQPNAPYYFIITMGEKNTGGYSIFITDIKIDKEKNVEVIVKETEPKPGSIVTMAFTYPACCLELNVPVNNIKIINTDGEIFNLISDF